MTGPKRRWFRGGIYALALCFFVTWAVLHLYFVLAIGILFTGISLYVGLLVAGESIVRRVAAYFRERKETQLNTDQPNH
jgi:uncharacterized membrane protein